MKWRLADENKSIENSGWFQTRWLYAHQHVRFREPEANAPWVELAAINSNSVRCNAHDLLGICVEPNITRGQLALTQHLPNLWNSLRTLGWWNCLELEASFPWSREWNCFWCLRPIWRKINWNLWKKWSSVYPMIRTLTWLRQTSK
jgi:hypothetical protein